MRSEFPRTTKMPAPTEKNETGGRRRKKFRQKRSPKSGFAPKRAPKRRSKITKKGEKRLSKTGMVSGPFPEVLFINSGMKKGGKIIKIPDEIRSANENGVFSRDVLFCRRQHENRCSGTSKIGPESGKKRSRDDVGDRGAFRE